MPEFCALIHPVITYYLHMQIRREVKIGILALIAIFVLIWGYQFLKGRNILSTSQIFIAEYSNTDELKKSNPIQVRGFQVGIVKEVYLNPKDLTKIIVEMDVRKDIVVPEGTIAEIQTTSMMGGRVIELIFPPQCLDGSCPPSGKYLKGSTQGFLNSMVGTENLDTYLNILETRLTALVDTLMVKFTENESLERGGKDIQGILANVRSATGRLDQLLANSSSSLQASLDNTASITGNLKDNNAQIKATLDNLAAISTQLKEQDVAGNIGSTVSELKTTIQQLDGAVEKLSSVLGKIENNEGTLGMLVNDKALHEQLQETLINIELLTQDIRLNPKRYTTVLSKKSKPYQKPEEDPGTDE
jgi:phospholipid/cholesterol/gamma-HCH transport system substrate-binding protein